MAKSIIRPSTPLLDITHPSYNKVFLVYVASNSNLSDQYELFGMNNFSTPMTTASGFSFASDESSGGTVLSYSSTGTPLVPVMPYSNNVQGNTTTNSLTFLARMNIISSSSTNSAWGIANNVVDGVTLANQDGTTLYSYVLGNFCGTEPINFGVWETWMVRWDNTAATIELAALSENGTKRVTTTPRSAPNPGPLNLSGGGVKFLTNTGGVTGTSILFDYCALWGRYLSDGEVSWVITNRANRPIWGGRPKRTRTYALVLSLTQDYRTPIDFTQSGFRDNLVPIELLQTKSSDRTDSLEFLQTDRIDRTISSEFLQIDMQNSLGNFEFYQTTQRDIPTQTEFLLSSYVDKSGPLEFLPISRIDANFPLESLQTGRRDSAASLEFSQTNISSFSISDDFLMSRTLDTDPLLDFIALNFLVNFNSSLEFLAPYNVFDYKISVDFSQTDNAATAILNEFLNVKTSDGTGAPFEELQGARLNSISSMEASQSNLVDSKLYNEILQKDIRDNTIVFDTVNFFSLDYNAYLESSSIVTPANSVSCSEFIVAGARNVSISLEWLTFPAFDSEIPVETNQTDRLDIKSSVEWLQTDLVSWVGLDEFVSLNFATSWNIPSEFSQNDFADNPGKVDWLQTDLRDFVVDLDIITTFSGKNFSIPLDFILVNFALNINVPLNYNALFLHDDYSYIGWFSSLKTEGTYQIEILNQVTYSPLMGAESLQTDAMDSNIVSGFTASPQLDIEILSEILQTNVRDFRAPLAVRAHAQLDSVSSLEFSRTNYIDGLMPSGVLGTIIVSDVVDLEFQSLKIKDFSVSSEILQESGVSFASPNEFNQTDQVDWHVPEDLSVLYSKDFNVPMDFLAQYKLDMSYLVDFLRGSRIDNNPPIEFVWTRIVDGSVYLELLQKNLVNLNISGDFLFQYFSSYIISFEYLQQKVATNSIVLEDLLSVSSDALAIVDNLSKNNADFYSVYSFEASVRSDVTNPSEILISDSAVLGFINSDWQGLVFSYFDESLEILEKRIIEQDISVEVLLTTSRNYAILGEFLQSALIADQFIPFEFLKSEFLYQYVVLESLLTVRSDKLLSLEYLLNALPFNFISIETLASERHDSLSPSEWTEGYVSDRNISLEILRGFTGSSIIPIALSTIFYSSLNVSTEFLLNVLEDGHAFVESEAQFATIFSGIIPFEWKASVISDSNLAEEFFKGFRTDVKIPTAISAAWVSSSLSAIEIKVLVLRDVQGSVEVLSGVSNTDRTYFEFLGPISLQGISKIPLNFDRMMSSDNVLLVEDIFGVHKLEIIPADYNTILLLNDLVYFEAESTIHSDSKSSIESSATNVNVSTDVIFVFQV